MSTLQTFNSDKLLERLRERARESGYDYPDRGLCEGCDAKLTEVDISMGECSQCGEVLAELEEEDESRDEDLVDDGYGDY